MPRLLIFVLYIRLCPRPLKSRSSTEVPPASEALAARGETDLGTCRNAA
jgi:hypothetical protein